MHVRSKGPADMSYDSVGASLLKHRWNPFRLRKKASIAGQIDSPWATLVNIWHNPFRHLFLVLFPILPIFTRAFLVISHSSVN